MIFLFHIPKTGGSELFRQMSQGRKAHNFGPDDPPIGVGLASTLAQLYDKDYDVTRMHCDANVLPWLPPDTKVVTMLRHPIERIYSLFRHASQSNSHELTPYAQDGLTSFLQAELPYRNCDNALTRRLAGMFYYDIPATPDHLATALDILDTFWHVGFRDTFSDTIQFINREMGWQMEDRGAPDWDNSHHQGLMERNTLDIELYIKAVQRYG